MSTDVTVRNASPADGPTIIKLIEALADYEKLPPPDAEAQQRLLNDAFGERPLFEIFLAEFEGVVAGYAFIFETYSTFLARPTFYLEDLFVLSEYRSRKVGYALFLKCVEESERRGCGRMEWTVLDWNVTAQTFYRRMGAKHMEEWFHYRLTRDQFPEILGQE